MTSFGFLSTYPPTQCGLAGFSAALLRHLTGQGSGDRAGVVRVVDAVQPAVHPGVVAQLVNGSPAGPATAAAVLNGFDVAVVQHEYGIYGGQDGEDVLRVLAEITVPAIVVLHTVLAVPSTRQRQVLERIADAAAAIVVMSRTAADRLGEGYLVDTAKVSVIPHGALSNRRVSPPASIDPFAPPAPVTTPSRPIVLTWGLLGPGKGIERAIEAFAGLGGLSPAPRYVIAGQTHPKVLEREGEAYRDFLGARAEDLGVGADVEFEPGYRNPDALMELVSSADVVPLPCDSTEQVTSGVLVEAVVAGRPIVATRFPHAVELLADGSGLLVPHGNVPAMTEALRTGPHRVGAGRIDDAGLRPPRSRSGLVRRRRLLPCPGCFAARRPGRGRGMTTGLSFAHLRRLGDDTGLFEHARGAVVPGGERLRHPARGQRTGGCCDGLEPRGRNENQGAESTLALISTPQHRRK